MPLITSSRLTDSGTLFHTIDYRDVGVILPVLPRINEDGFIRLEVTPEISSLALSGIETQPGVRSPIINQRRAREQAHEEIPYESLDLRAKAQRKKELTPSRATDRCLERSVFPE